MRRFGLVLAAGLVISGSWAGPGVLASPASAAQVIPGISAAVPPAAAVPPVMLATAGAAVAALAPAVTVGREAFVAVSAATLWRTPRSARVVDRPAVANPASIRLWLSRMTLTDRRGLGGRADTQALMGDRVLVTGRSGLWVKVLVPDQPTPLDRRGYPGWLPTAQLTAARPAVTPLVAAVTPLVATVTARTTFLRTDTAAVRAVTEISFGTRLPRVGVVGGWVRVLTPTGLVRRVSASAVAVRAPRVAAMPASGTDIVRAAQIFTGLPYLWPDDLASASTARA